jgi:hypothetical protein
MAVRIQLRRDTAANWVSTNPVLRAGELGIETDTLKFKIGNGSAWNSITTYANVVPSDLNTTLGDYVTVNDIGAQGGVVGLNNSYNAIIPGSSIIIEGPTADSYETTLTVTDPTADRTITLPDATGTVALISDLPSQYTDELAQDAAAAALAAGTHTNITVTYNDNANSISLAAAPGYVDEQAVDAVAAALAAGTHTNITVGYNDAGNAISLTGAVTYTDENAQDAVGNAVGTGLSYNDSTGAISVDTSTIQARVTNVTDTEIGYLDGVSSAIQTQLNDKLASATASTTYAPIASPTFTGTVTLPGAPSSALHAATKAYVDNIATGLNFHPAVHFATSTNITTDYNNGTDGLGATLTAMANGPIGTIDGHQAVLGDRALVKAQTDAKQNGIYYVSSIGGASSKWVLTRALDADNSPTGEIANGDFCFVQNGVLAGGYGFIVNTTGTITIGTTDINYTQFNAGQSVVAGNGLSEPTVGTIAIDTTITADLSTAQTLTNKTITGTFTGNLTGNADTVTNGVVTTGTYSNPSWITGLAWSKISSTPTTISGYGITNALLNTGGSGSVVTNATASDVGFLVKGAASQSGDYFQIQGSSGTVLANFNASNQFNVNFGSIYSPYGIRAGSNNHIGLASVSAFSINAGYLALGIKGFTGQTADLTQWQNSSGTVIAKIDATGNITAPSLTLSSTALATTSGGTGLSSYTAGDIIYSSATDTLAKLAKGTDGQILTLASGVPSWAAAPITLPTQTDNGGKYLTTDGTTASWGTLVVPITTGTATITANTATTIDTNALSGFTSIEYMVSLKQGSKVRTSKVIVQTDGTSVDMTEFAITETGGTIAGVVISAAVSSTNAVLQVTATDAATTNVTVKFSEIKL